MMMEPADQLDHETAHIVMREIHDADDCGERGKTLDRFEHGDRAQRAQHCDGMRMAGRAWLLRVIPHPCVRLGENS